MIKIYVILLQTFYIIIMKKNKILISILLIIIIKALFLLTKHIQEDAFITWRVAQNILDYGVYGFNGDERISSSTTHLYVFISVLFKLIFSENFIYPLLIFNSIIYTWGTKILSDILIVNDNVKILFLFFVNFLPPSIKISILGMEFGLIFFLYILFLKYAVLLRRNWAFLLLPILISWTRLDAAMFLLINFFYDLFRYRKPNYFFILSGILSVITILGFNYFYFHEIINNTIVAKRLAYANEADNFMSKFIGMLNNTNYYSMLKIPLNILKINIFLIITIFLSIFSFYKISKNLNREQKYILSIIYTYAWVRIIVFGFANSWFDWYYWIPQIFMFIPIILYFIQDLNKIKIILYFVIFFIPLVTYQTVHSIATGHGEWEYNRKVGLYLDSIEPDKSKTVFLEPAGYIPYFSKLKAIDYVGLVDKRVLEEFKIKGNNVAESVIMKYRPDYILEDNKPMFKGDISKEEASRYELIKEFHILQNAKSDNFILDKIYKLKPSGRDYYLYKRIN